MGRGVKHPMAYHHRAAGSAQLHAPLRVEKTARLEKTVLSCNVSASPCVTTVQRSIRSKNTNDVLDATLHLKRARSGCPAASTARFFPPCRLYSIQIVVCRPVLAGTDKKNPPQREGLTKYRGSVRRGAAELPALHAAPSRADTGQSYIDILTLGMGRIT